MGQQFAEMSEAHIGFIRAQKLFFVATAAPQGHINLSPKGLDSLRVLNPNRVVWLNLTGSGNETAAQVQEDPRMTLMFAAFEGRPQILRLYGKARVVHRNDAEWSALYSRFDPLPGARQLFDVAIDLVQTSCGMGVPLFDYRGEREQLTQWAEKQGADGIARYWRDRNRLSLDGRPTRIIEKNL